MRTGMRGDLGTWQLCQETAVILVEWMQNAASGRLYSWAGYDPTALLRYPVWRWQHGFAVNCYYSFTVVEMCTPFCDDQWMLLRFWWCLLLLDEQWNAVQSLDRPAFMQCFCHTTCFAIDYIAELLGVVSWVNLLALDLFFLILSQPVYKMWILQEPKKLALWNKLHFEEKNKENIENV